MSILDTIEKPIDRAVICTITGDAGVGKTSLSATFPNPVFIRAEDGMQSIPADVRPDAFPLIQKVEDLWSQLTSLINEKHEYKTIVIDSVTRLETLFIEYILATDPKQPKSINQALGGYGAGMLAVGAMHARVRKACGILNARGMHIVFIAHIDTNTIDLPDEESYTRYDLRLGKKSISSYVDDVDMVAFLKLETFTTGDGEKKKAMSDGTRLAICFATAANISKNRYGITEPITVIEGVNPFTNYIKTLNKD